MAYPPYLREKARRLRVEKRLTIDELAQCLAPSRTTIYYWVRDLPPARSPSGVDDLTRQQWLISASTGV